MASLALGQDAGTPDPTMDAMERRLETNRHERLLSHIVEVDTVVTDFTTDGCSGGLSAGWEYLSARYPELAAAHGERPPWEDCCVAHDREYHAGGVSSVSASESFERRKAADLALESCVAATGAQRSTALQDEYGLSVAQVETLYGAIAALMYRAVRLGGVPCTAHPWRWGYGWPECR